MCMCMCVPLYRQNSCVPCSEEASIDSEPAIAAAILETEPRSPLTDPAPYQGEAYGSVKLG